MMASVVKWKPIHSETTSDNFSLRLNSSKYCSYSPKGHVGNLNSLIFHSLKSILRPKVRQQVIARVQIKEADKSCSSEFGYEDNETVSSAYQRRDGNQLRALESYFSKLYAGEGQQLGFLPEKKNNKNGSSFMNKGTKSFRSTSTEDYKDNLILDEKNFLYIHEDDQTSNFFLTNILAAINIAVLLFETASPVKDSENEYLSLPLIYGAKINDLILSGEWWRLVTPMWLVFLLILCYI